MTVMAGRGFCVKVQLELHAITCPGVWLCPNGKVALRITSLGSTLESHRVSPIFPLLFHNEFKFKKTFTRLAALTELQRNLEQEFLYAELIQWLSPCNQPIVLATFETDLAEVLYPVPHYKGLLAGVDVDLLMDPTKYFPGIIAPKIEISTKTTIEEILGICNENVDGTYVINPKTIKSKQTSCALRKRPVKGIIRQRKVCHSRAKPRDQHCQSTRYRCNVESSNVQNSYLNLQPHINLCYHPAKEIPKCLRNINAKGKDYQIPSVCGNAHIFDSCPVCFKYKCYFACERGQSNAEQGGIDKHKEHSESFERIDHLYDSCRCCTCRVDEYISHEPTSIAQRKAWYLGEKSYWLEKDCKAKDVSGCDTIYMRGQEEAKRGFYKNLERFYKRMYKQAKLRAQEAND